MLLERVFGEEIVSIRQLLVWQQQQISMCMVNKLHKIRAQNYIKCLLHVHHHSSVLFELYLHPCVLNSPCRGP